MVQASTARAVVIDTTDIGQPRTGRSGTTSSASLPMTRTGPFDPPVPVRNAATVMLAARHRRRPRGVHAAPHAQGGVRRWLLRLPRRGRRRADRGRRSTPWSRPRRRRGQRRAGHRAGGLAVLGRRRPRVLRGGGRAARPPADGELVRFDDPAVAGRFTTHRTASTTATLRLVDLCAAEGLRLAATASST